MNPLVTMREAVTDPALLGTMFEGPSWAIWKALLIASRGELLTDEETALYAARTGRNAVPDAPVDEAAFIAGRRSGKTVSAAALAVYLAALCDWSDVLSRGERGVMLFLAQSQRTAKIAFRYADGLFTDVPMLAKMVTGRTQDTISLNNGVDLEIRPASFRGLRGMTAIGVIADEVAFWFSDDSANPDVEILNAVRPALATTGGPVLLVSSPYARRGELWETYRRHYGPTGDPRILVAQGASRDFNDTLPQSVVDRAIERDPSRATAEYLGQFRTDVEGFLSVEAVRACIEAGVRERAADREHRYVGFIDPSGGSADSMTLSIAHREGETAVLDVVREIRPPFNPEATVEEFASVLRQYRVSRAYGDRYAGEWVASAFRKAGIYYEASEKSKSELYRDLLPAINAGAAVLLDDERLVSQLTQLERRTTRGGRDSIDHPPGGHDDAANAAAGALVYAASGPALTGYDLARRQTVALGADYDVFDPEGSTRRQAARQGILDVACGGNARPRQAVAGVDYDPFGGG